MKVVFRCDASVDIGTGHVMRCLTLANCLREHSAEVEFISRELKGSIFDVIEEQGFLLHKLSFQGKETVPKIQHIPPSSWLHSSLEQEIEETKNIFLRIGPIDWIIVDHYALHDVWERSMRSATKKIMVIDDLANRKHECDVLLNQNLASNMYRRYDSLVSFGCKKFIGPSYALLRNEFRLQRQQREREQKIVENILIFFGGADISNQTERILSLLLQVAPSCNYDVVIGASNPHKTRIEELCSHSSRIQYSCNVQNMAERMMNADFCVGAAGTTMWERCAVGLPTAILIVAENQREGAIAAHQQRIVFNLGDASQVSDIELVSTLGTLMRDVDACTTMSKLAMEMVDGYGAERVAEALISMNTINTHA